MKRVSLFLREDQLEQLERRSRETGAAVAELVRRAVDAYFTKREQKK